MLLHKDFERGSKYLLPHLISIESNTFSSGPRRCAVLGLIEFKRMIGDITILVDTNGAR